MARVAVTIVGIVLLLAGVGVAIAHYLLESSLTTKYITVAIAAALASRDSRSLIGARTFPVVGG